MKEIAVPATRPTYAESALAVCDAARNGELGGAGPYDNRAAGALKTVAMVAFGANVDLAALPVTASFWEAVFETPSVRARVLQSPGATGTQMISMVRSILRRYRTSIEPEPQTTPDTGFATLIARASDPTVRRAARLGPQGQQLIPLKHLSDLARAQDKRLDELDRSWFVDALDDQSVEKPAQIKAAAKVLDRLRELPDFEDLLPRRPIGQLTVRAKRRARLELPDSWHPHNDIGAAYELHIGPDGAPREIGNPYEDNSVDAIITARRWYASCLLHDGIVSDLNTADIRDIAQPKYLRESVANEIRGRYPWTPLKAQTLFGYIYRVSSWLEFHNKEFQDLPQDIKKANKFLRFKREMSEENKRVCLTFLMSPAWQKSFFSMPARHFQEIKQALPTYKKMNRMQQLNFLHLAIGTAIAAILTVVPLRMDTLLKLDHNNIVVRWSESGTTTEIALRPDQMKMKKARRFAISPRKSFSTAEILDFFKSKIRPLILGSEIQTPNPELVFLGMSRKQLTQAWAKITASAGYELNPHQARHMVASYILHRRPDSLPFVAALLGNEPETCRLYYAFVFLLNLSKRADEMLREEIDKLLIDYQSEAVV